MDPFLILALGMAAVVGGILLLRLHAFIALLAGAILVAALSPDSSLATAGPNVATAFGKTAGKIAILIAMAAVIGKCLLESGAADQIVRSALRLFSERLAPLAFMGSGFLLGVPVYFDTLFYLLVPLAKTTGLRNPDEYGRYIMGIIAGGTMAHSLVPPTPGPLLVADELGVDIGTMMIGGFVVGAFTCVIGYFYAVIMNRRKPIPLRDSADVSLADLSSRSKTDGSSLPPLWLSVLPILLPVILIGGNSIIGTFDEGTIHAFITWFFSTFGEKNLALVISAAVALLVLLRQKGGSLKDQQSAIGSALASGGVIILITSAGGAFGGVLQQSGITERIGALAADSQIGLIPLAFFLTTLIRTAQGSATVAMITTVGIIGSIAAPDQLGFHAVYLALAIGCGSKPFPWMNDSGFWIIGRMSGMTEKETFRAFSFMITLMALGGMILLMIAAKIWPAV